MITIETVVFSKGLYVRFNIPKNGKVVYEISTARSLDEAKRMMYFRNRNYIYKKLHTWLQHRGHALSSLSESTDYAEKLATIEELILKLEHYKKASFWHLCAFVCKKKGEFLFVAPGEKSRHCKFFQREILPVLEFCVKMKGAAE